MKRSTVILSTALLSSSFAYADTPEGFAAIKKKFMKEPLMASHLSKQLAKSLHTPSPLTYATGHRFYDTPVVLVDDEGNKITHQYQYNPKKHYQLISQGATTLAEESIWFFSPNGANPEELDYDSCTFESPCQQLTQDVVNYVHAYDSYTPKYWLASGTYDLPVVSQKNLNPKLIELHVDEMISGRTTDLIHTAYDDDRPLIIGTLAWNDYRMHYGTRGSARNLKIKTSNNRANLAEYDENTNIYSSGSLELVNAELEYSSSDDTPQFATNIIAQNVYMFDSNLKIQGVYTTNIMAESQYIYQSTLNASGYGISNIDSSGGSGHMNLWNTTLRLEEMPSSGDYTYVSTAIRGFGSSAYLASVDIEITSQQSDNFSYPLAINYNLTNPERSFDIINSKINISSTGNLAAIHTNKMTIENTQMMLKSTNASVLAFVSTDTVEFVDAPSTITLYSPVMAEVFANTTLINNSTPPSQCVINDGESRDC